MTEAFRKNLEAELQEQEERHHSVVKSMAEGMIYRDAHKIVREVNASAERILGLKAEEMLGKKTFDVKWKVITEYGAPFAKGEHPATATLRTGLASKNVIMGILRDNKNPLWISVSSEPVFHEGETKPYAVVTTFSDITQRKQDEEKLRKSQKQLNDITSSIGEGVYVLNNYGRISFFNPEGEQLLGYTQEELLGKNSHEIFHYHTSYQDCPVSRTLSQGAKIRTDNDYFVRKDGTLLPVSYITTPIIEEKQIIGCVVAFKDITERQRAEKELSFAAKIIENVQEGVLVIDEGGIIQTANPSFCRILGYNCDELIGESNKILKSPNHDITFYHEILNILQERGRWQGEIWARSKDDRDIPSWVTISAMKDKFENITKYVYVFRDITERKKYEELIRFQAYHDTLTGLPNRRLFNDRIFMALAQAKRDGNLLAVIFLDFDHFKAVNDELGHDIGDLLLQNVSERLLAAVRIGDTVARLGGDEFIILLSKLKSVNDIKLVADKIRQCFQQTFELAGHKLRITSSIGISYYPKDGEEANILIKKADTAMYQAKKKRNTCEFYNENM